jgi:hypothetical protein
MSKRFASILRCARRARRGKILLFFAEVLTTRSLRSLEYTGGMAREWPGCFELRSNHPGSHDRFAVKRYKPLQAEQTGRSIYRR